MAKTDETKLKFEQAIEALESIIDRIEQGQIGLEDGLKEYERGVKLVSRLRSILDAAEQRIAELAADPQGGLRVVGAIEADEDVEGDDANDE